MELTVTGLFRHPVKSCRGEDLEVATVERWGFAGDRRWMVVDSHGECVTAREFHRLVLARPALVAGGLLLSGDGARQLFVPTPADPSVEITVHGRGPYPAVLAADEAHRWFSDFIDEPVRLVYQPDPSTRPVNPLFGGPDARVALQDAYPLLVTTTASLDAVNEAIALGRFPHEGPLPMRRFRPNIVVESDEAWAEDRWRRVRIGDVTFRAVKGCDRCVLTTVDPDTAAHGKEPIASLARIRKWDGTTWFGMQLVPEEPFGEIRVGARFEILDAVRETDGPPR